MRATGHIAGTSPAERTELTAESSTAAVHVTVAPRLLSVEAAAVYLSVCAWTVRDYVASGKLPAVRLPATGSRGKKPESRRVLLDVRDLDAFIEQRKERATP